MNECLEEGWILIKFIGKHKYNSLQLIVAIGLIWKIYLKEWYIYYYQLFF